MGEEEIGKRVEPSTGLTLLFFLPLLIKKKMCIVVIVIEVLGTFFLLFCLNV